MNLIGTTAGALALLTSAQQWQRSTQVIGGGNDWRVRLFTNNVTITDATVLGGLTEAAWSGYAYVQPAWGTAALLAGVPTVVGPIVTFTYTGGSTVTNYGVYVTDAANSQLVGAANFSPTVVLTVALPSWSGQINVTVISQF